MLESTVGQVLLNDLLPENMRNYARVFDKKGTSSLLTELGKKHPDKYRDVLHALHKTAHKAAYWSGGNSFGPTHMSVAKSARPLREELRRKVEAIWSDDKLSDEQKEHRVLETTLGYQEKLEKAVFDESLAEKNPLAYQVISGARGNKTNLRGLRAGDLLYVDSKDNPIPVPILRSYAEGLSPFEYFAGSYGARKGLVEGKTSVADSGFASKQLVQLSHRLLTTAHDADGYDENNPRGMPVAIDDADNEGSVLAHPVGGYKRNTLLTPRVLNDLKSKGITRLLLRSPTVGGPADGGVYAMDVGVREKGRIPATGDFVGVAAAQALSEPLTQSTLGSKHQGGVAGAKGGATGFAALNQLIQIPATFAGGAAHAQHDGKVSLIEEAPQGGHWVHINGQKHYVARGYAPMVKVGDEVEAGDVLSEGTPNPAEIVKHKGVGEGRRYFTEAFVKAYKNSGMQVHRRNVELIARGLIDHIKLTGEFGRHVPDDVVNYSRFEHEWEPREDHKTLDPRQARGLYLERPVLHYSIGTRVRPSVIKQLTDHGVKQIAVHHEAPPFEPKMIRAMENLAHDPDWQTRFLGSYQKKNFLRGIARGDWSDESGSSYVPALTRSVDFGRQGAVQGWKPSALEQTPTPEPVVKSSTVRKRLKVSLLAGL